MREFQPYSTLCTVKFHTADPVPYRIPGVTVIHAVVRHYHPGDGEFVRETSVGAFKDTNVASGRVAKHETKMALFIIDYASWQSPLRTLEAYSVRRVYNLYYMHLGPSTYM